MICEKCWIYLTHGYTCKNERFKEFTPTQRLLKLVNAVRDALHSANYNVAHCALDQIEQEAVQL